MSEHALTMVAGICITRLGLSYACADSGTSSRLAYLCGALSRVRACFNLSPELYATQQLLRGGGRQQGHAS